MQSRERFQNNYDFLRVFAALCIIFSHCFGLSGKFGEEPLAQFTKGTLSFSFIGLSIFFCISGYLIAKSANSSPTLKNYLWKRVLRIQPLLILVCILTIFLLGPIFTNLTVGQYFLNANSWSYFRNILPVFGLQFTLPGVFVHNVSENGVNGSLWTLILEERLYIVMVIVFLFRKQNPDFFIILIGLLNALYLGNRFFFHGNMDPFLSDTTFFYGLLFLNSAVLYFLNINFLKSRFLLILLVIICFIMAVVFPRLDFIFLFSIPVLVNSVAKIKGFTNNAGIYGDFTYGIYVFSFPVQQMFLAAGIINENPYKLYLCTLIIVVPMAFLSWNIIEKKCLGLKNLVQ